MRAAQVHFSLLKEWGLPVTLLACSALGIIALAVLGPSDHPRATQSATPELSTQATLAALASPAEVAKKTAALQTEIDALQTLLLSELKRITATNSRSKSLEHQLARLSVAADELQGIEGDFAAQRGALEALQRVPPSANPAPVASPTLLFRGGMILFALLGIGAAVGLIRRMAENITKPVAHFVDVARSITHGRAKIRASVEAAGHFWPLAEAFNQMIDARQQAETRLQQAHDSLELKIQARTIELFRSNKALLEETQQRAQAERDFQQAQKMDALGKLAGSIAHDFNNLLTVIIGGAECAQQKLAPNHPAVSLLQTVQQAGERAAGLTRPLLTFSRSQVLAVEAVNLNTAVEEAGRMLQRLIGVNINLRLDLAPDLHPVQANGNQIQQVIMNLAVNARDAMNGFGNLTILTRPATVDAAACERAGVAASEYWVELAVADTGSGMDEATKARIFEPFFTTKPAGRGTGLGLATVFGIVKQSNGILAVESTLGEGSTFRVFLPASSAAAAVPVAEPSPVRDETPRIHGCETILLVDDEEDLRELATITLESEGYRVLAAPNAEEAIALAEKHVEEIRALVTDVVMPGMTGVQLAGVLTKIIPGLRVLFVSGHNNESIASDTHLAAQSDYLQKPYRGHILVAKVHEILTASKLRPSASWSAEELAEAV
jgi:signal transduction histidine kinase/ActR/RegA family two-component response regulator